MELKHIDFIDEKIYQTVINGLKTYIIPKKGYSKKFAMITVDYGSNDIKFSKDSQSAMKEYPLGIAHFLEHKLFEEKDGNVFDKFSKLGASTNAYTNFENTAYYFTCTDNFYDNIKLLVQFVFNPYFTEENVEKEKGIIEQEIRMYDDNPGFKVYFNALLGMYNSHPVRNDIAGTVESIYSITPEMLYECYNTFYNPNNMVMVIVGDIDIEKTESIVKDTVPNKGNFDAILFNHIESPNVREKEVVKDMGISIPNFIIGFKDTKFKSNSKEMLKRNIAMNIIGKLLLGRSSKMYEELYEKGLINESFSYEYNIEKEYAYLIFGGESKDPKAINAFILNYFESKSFEIKSSDVERVKKSMLGAYVSRFNSIEGIGNYLSKYFIGGINPFEYKDIIKEIEIKDLLNLIDEIIKEKNNVVSIIS